VTTVTDLEICSDLLSRGDRDTIEQAGGGARIGVGEGFDGAVSGEVPL
jgi:hypothetical protein